MSDWLGGIGSWLGNNANWLVPTAVMGGSALYGMSQNNAAANTQANALQQAMATQQQSNDNSINFLRYAYDTSRGDQAPFRAAGQAALSNMLPQVTNGFQASPGYQFAQDEAMRAVQNSAASRGMLGSGATMKALQDRAANLANQEYGNYWNRLAGLAGVGQTATNASGAAAQQFGQGAAGVTANTGNALAGLQGNIGNVLGQAQIAQGANVMQGANGLLGYFSQNPGWWK